MSGRAVTCPVAVVIPARNEARRLPACLFALQRAMTRLGRPVHPVIVVNDSCDDTAMIARRILDDFHWSGAVLEPGGAPGVGAARALGFDHALSRCGPQTLLLGTDADSRVDEDWLLRMTGELTSADLVFGAVDPDSAELARLRTAPGRLNDGEGLYMQMAVRLAALLDPLPHDPAPGHHNPSGANFGLTAASYRRIGGIPPLRLSEDRELARRAERFDLRLRYSDGPRVITSCRLTGRTGGGMAAALRARCDDPDPLCDEWLEPARIFAFRHGLRGALRRCWPDPEALSRRLRFLHLAAPEPRTGACFGAFWQEIEDRHPALRRQRISQSRACRDLPLLRAILRRHEISERSKAS